MLQPIVMKAARRRPPRAECPTVLRVSRDRDGGLLRRLARLLTGSVIVFACLLATRAAAGPPDDAGDDRSPGAVPEQRTADEIIASGKLHRFEPLSTEQALASFEVAEGYEIELVAAEPLVVDPVAFCFDARGRLIVVEMRGYSERAESNTGRIRRLTDTDGDGRMDEVETLLDGLAWPTAVAVWGDGVVIGVAPDLRFVPASEDHPGEAETWYTGFGKSNVQGLLNSFRWGPDLRLHGATSSSGGEIRAAGSDEVLRLGRRDFALRYPSRQLDAVAGGAQHGLSFGRWGDKFVCSNSDHLQQVLMLPEREARASRYSGSPPMRRSIAADGRQADVFRLSPVEPWRILRTHLRVTGQVGGPIEGGGRAAGYFTGATGVHAYLGDQWPDGESLVLVCDVGSNLVHRKRLQPDGLWYRGERIDEGTEFVRSSDTWFRPVQLGDGPDGALYIADMYREVIEHPKSLPPKIKSQVDLNSGNRRGRIWRVVAKERPVRRGIDKPLDAMPTDALVTVLGHANGWHRRTAARLLMQRQDRQAVGTLRELASGSPQPEMRLEALAVLATFAEGIDRATRDASLGDRHPRVRQRALQIAADDVERLGPLPRETWELLSQDLSPHVCFQLAYEAIVLIPAEGPRAEALASIAKQHPDDPWIRWAVEGSLGSAADRFLSLAGGELLQSDAAAAWSHAIACQTLHAGGEAAVRRLVGWLEGQQDGAGAVASSLNDTAMLAAVADELPAKVTPGLKPLAEWVTADLVPSCRDKGESGAWELPADRHRLRLVRWATPAEAKNLLETMLASHQPPAAQRLALQTLLGTDRGSSDWLVDRLRQLTPAVQAEAFEALGSTRSGLKSVAAAVEAGRLSMSMVPQDFREQMTRAPDAEVRRVVSDLASAGSAAPETVARYTRVLDGSGDPQAGAAIFKRLCAVCHQPQPGARPVGPSLKSVVDKSPEQILLSVLDPNREVDPKYYRVQLVSAAGRVYSGIVVEESAASLLLVDDQGREHNVLREEIDTLQTSERSLMPDDLAKELKPSELRDLIVYLKRGLE